MAFPFFAEIFLSEAGLEMPLEAWFNCVNPSEVKTPGLDQQFIEEVLAVARHFFAHSLSEENKNSRNDGWSFHRRFPLLCGCWLTEGNFVATFPFNMFA